jgi:hypothetical protein
VPLAPDDKRYVRASQDLFKTDMIAVSRRAYSHSILLRTLPSFWPER